MQSEGFMPFSPSERAIYRFHNGTEVVAVDPLAVLRKIEAVDGLALKEDLQIAAAEGEEFQADANAAVGRLVAAAREALGVKPFAEVQGKQWGLTDSESLALLVDFVTFVGGLAREAVPFASSPAPTASPVSESATDSSSECGSIKSESP